VRQAIRGIVTGVAQLDPIDDVDTQGNEHRRGDHSPPAIASRNIGQAYRAATDIK
jgi:hypothetical protein